MEFVPCVEHANVVPIDGTVPRLILDCFYCFCETVGMGVDARMIEYIGWLAPRTKITYPLPKPRR